MKKRYSFRGKVSRNVDQQARAKQFGYLNLPKGLPVFKEEAGRVDLDIIPYTVGNLPHPDRDEEYEIAVPGSLWYRRPFWVHRGVTTEAVVCPSTIKQPCPICEYRAQLLKEGADWRDDSVRALKPSLRNLYFVVPRGHKKFEQVVHVWDISQFAFQDKLNEEISENEAYEIFPDPVDGLTLRVRFVEETFAGNRFCVVSRIDFIERAEDYSGLLDELPCLDDLLVYHSYGEIESMFLGGPGTVLEEDEEEEEEDEPEEPRPTPKPAGTARFVSKRVEEDEDEEEEEEDEEEEEEDEPEPPAKPQLHRKDKQAVPVKKTAGKCPHGYRFGKDCDAHDECEDCELWEECLDAEVK